MKLVLIRHGRTEANERRLYCGSTDLPLSPAGAEALRTAGAEALRRRFGGFRFLSSGMRRCDETLRILFGEVPFEVEPRFAEMDFGGFEMRAFGELKDDPAYLAWISGDNEANVAPGGESGRQMEARVFKALDELLGRGGDAVLVTHGGPIAAIMARLFPDEGKNRYEWLPKNGGGYIVEIGDGAILWSRTGADC